MILPAQFANEVRNGTDIVFCPYCSRILFYQDQEDGENEFFNIEDAGSLADFEDDFDEEDIDDEDNDGDDNIKELDYEE